MKHRPVEQWSIAKSLALLAAIFAVVVGATLPTAVAASSGVGHAVQLCSGEQVFVLDDGRGGPLDRDPASGSLECAACLAAAFAAVIPLPPSETSATPPCLTSEDGFVTSDLAAAVATRPAPRPPSTAPPIA